MLPGWPCLGIWPVKEAVAVAGIVSIPGAQWRHAALTRPLSPLGTAIVYGESRSKRPVARRLVLRGGCVLVEEGECEARILGLNPAECVKG